MISMKSLILRQSLSQSLVRSKTSLSRGWRITDNPKQRDKRNQDQIRDPDYKKTKVTIPQIQLYEGISIANLSTLLKIPFGT